RPTLRDGVRLAAESTFSGGTPSIPSRSKKSPSLCRNLWRSFKNNTLNAHVSSDNFRQSRERGAMSFFKTTILLGLMTGLLMVIGGLLGGRHGVAIFFVIAAVMNFFSYWFSDKIVLRAYGATELDASSAPELYSIVNELAHSAGIPMPRLYLIDSDTPNAFATGRNVHHAAVAVTRGIMRICTREE